MTYWMVPLRSDFSDNGGFVYLRRLTSFLLHFFDASDNEMALPIVLMVM